MQQAYPNRTAPLGRFANFIRRWQAATRLRGGFDVSLLALVLVLLGLGLLMVLSSSYPRAYSEALSSGSGSALSYFNKQLVFAVVGVIALYIASWIPLSVYREFTWVIYAIAVLALFAVLIAGRNVNGATRWIDIGPVRLQPSEILKLAIILVFADLISRFRSRMGTLKYGLAPFGAAMLIPVLLLYKEPHISCIIIIGVIGLGMMVIGGTPKRFILYGFLALVVLGVLAYLFSDHVHARVDAYLNPSAYATDDVSYQVRESLMAIGSGGLTGLGPGEGRQKFLYLPESHNDYIFAVVCEELGFLGAAAIVILLALMLFRCVLVTLNTDDRFSFLVASGITIHLMLQTVMNIFVVTNTIPCTGVSLPFFSYGGTALMMQLMEMGVLLSISREAKLRPVRRRSTGT